MNQRKMYSQFQFLQKQVQRQRYQIQNLQKQLDHQKTEFQKLTQQIKLLQKNQERRNRLQFWLRQQQATRHLQFQNQQLQFMQLKNQFLQQLVAQKQQLPIQRLQKLEDKGKKDCIQLVFISLSIICLIFVTICSIAILFSDRQQFKQLAASFFALTIPYNIYQLNKEFQD